ncbi:MAG: DUF2780 domain-containing protein [Symploca sp. SIO3C6]|uniref:DUF2780 domain-containing protein n=1 Tax=Symploca sp. SIO1C4 TaxID=2607765 RepID=A0A6B3NM63_9CYAN|nr:DUF2780 domain-containing protein [Symploca sp. SIO3C6]NER31995.1 DUF2780 domain-containing protein [Symploca sp. SIO1C4]NET07559.1 DUF2780 domain-containing protein [Symploca sp. SIO2B6]NET49556.1 DUF2780 domain-containing protein [Merismopedia sp. SIO2A8]
MELIQLLTQNLGVQESQAMGGAGLIFQLAKEKLGEDNFSTIAQYVPGIGDMLQEAPQAAGILGALGGLASAMGGEAAGIGNLVNLAGGFSQLGLDGGMVGQFVPIILSYLQNQGGDEIKSLLEQVLN